MKPLNYRDPKSADGTHFAEWLRNCKGKSGAYVIRSKQTSEILYVGESHTGRLYGTITRHFQDWHDRKGWLFSKEMRHFTCQANRVEVAIRICPPTAAPGAQDNLIQRLDPRENRQGYDPNPF